ncbi:IS3 family transposase [Symbiopectobacterium purcellii]|uniref:IS3 family transposase n=1 Tax=Symbiopectobacterium purcellii TaxID=2871826 RepID=UPI003F87D933
MTQSNGRKMSNNRYPDEFRENALLLAQRIGVAKAASELNLHESQLYAWRKKQQMALSCSEREQQQSVEIVRLKRQLADQAEELAIPPKGRDVLRQTPEVRYVFMQQYQAEFRVKSMARVLVVSRSGFYAWSRRCGQKTVSQQRRELCDTRVASAFTEQKGRNGARRLRLDLQDAGYHYNRKTIAASLRRQGLKAKAAKKFRVTTDSKHNRPVAPNLLQQDFTASAPNQKWVGDITYLWTEAGWVYLAVIIDLFSRAVVGWSMSVRMKSGLVCDALQMALSRRGSPEGVIVHSDRGSQYCSDDYQKLIKISKLTCSMSGKGNYYDNACAESFFHSLKVELIHGEHFPDRETMKSEVFNYIEVDYNQKRRHSTLGYVSPMVFERQVLS